MSLAKQVAYEVGHCHTSHCSWRCFPRTAGFLRTLFIVTYIAPEHWLRMVLFCGT